MEHEFAEPLASTSSVPVEIFANLRSAGCSRSCGRAIFAFKEASFRCFFAASKLADPSAVAKSTPEFRISFSILASITPVETLYFASAFTEGERLFRRNFPSFYTIQILPRNPRKP